MNNSTSCIFDQLKLILPKQKRMIGLKLYTYTQGAKMYAHYCNALSLKMLK